IPGVLEIPPLPEPRESRVISAANRIPKSYEVPLSAPITGGNDLREMKERLEQGQDREMQGHASGFTCPECGGVLWESNEHDLQYFRCRTGHGYSPESLQAQQAATLESTLWAAVRALEETAALARKMLYSTPRERGPAVLNAYRQRARQADTQADVLRRILVHNSELEEQEELRVAAVAGESRVGQGAESARPLEGSEEWAEPAAAPAGAGAASGDGQGARRASDH